MGNQSIFKYSFYSRYRLYFTANPYDMIMKLHSYLKCGGCCYFQVGLGIHCIHYYRFKDISLISATMLQNKFSATLIVLICRSNRSISSHLLCYSYLLLLLFSIMLYYFHDMSLVRQWGTIAFTYPCLICDMKSLYIKFKRSDLSNKYITHVCCILCVYYGVYVLIIF